MKRFIITCIMLLVLCGTAGCVGQAGAATDLTTYDNAILAANEGLKGVQAFNSAVMSDTGKRQADMVNAIGTGIERLALKDDKMTPAEAAELSVAVKAEISKHLANYSEQEKRREALYRVTVDNLQYIIEICEQGKKFSLYRADVNAQWKAYLEASLRSRISKIPAEPNPFTTVPSDKE